MTFINLNKTRATGDGLEHLKNFPNLADLQLADTFVANAGLRA